MKKITDQICKKTLKLEQEVDDYRYKYTHTFAEKEDYSLKFREEKEKHQKL
jgi:hypothetical protein